MLIIHFTHRCGDFSCLCRGRGRCRCRVDLEVHGVVERVLKVGERLGARQPDLFLVARDAVGIERDVAVLALQVVVTDLLDMLSDAVHRGGIDDEAAG
jgi:hypothetical protein